MTGNTINAIEKAIKCVGTHKICAELCGISRQAVTRWLKTGIPARHVIALEKATGGKVTRYELRPDLYPRD